ncbi:MAG TPA: CRTAC1 family protein [Longimicrobiales bacterium]|nr:CRTAC1 family protein [Longimicrobiales bacterium]
MRFRIVLAAASAVLAACSAGDQAVPADDLTLLPSFLPLQGDLFSAAGAQPNAWADYDLDGDLDLFVGFRGRANRLYRNDAGTFTDVADSLGLADEEETRAAAWGDYDGDGDLDLYVGFADSMPKANRLYRNDERGQRFTDVAGEAGVRESGNTRQPVFVDYDGDNDLDLFVAFREKPNRLYRNDGGTFTDVAEAAGVADPRRTVGAVWFDMDGDADLDLFVANQNGDEDGVFINQGDGTFRDMAAELGMNAPGRAAELGSVGVAVADYDNDGDLDLFVASYGPDVLWQNQGDGTFRNVAAGTPLAADAHSVAAAWGDYDNDGSVDLFVGRYLSGQAQVPDVLYRNAVSGFEEVTPVGFLEQGASHGVAWADYDMDGDLDLALGNNDPAGTHPLYVNGLPAARGARSLQVLVLDGKSAWTRPGAKVTATAEDMVPEHPEGYRAARLVDAGGGYCSQGAQPVHFGFPAWVTRVSVQVVWFEKGQARTATVTGVELAKFQHQWLVLRLGVQ